MARRNASEKIPRKTVLDSKNQSFFSYNFIDSPDQIEHPIGFLCTSIALRSLVNFARSVLFQLSHLTFFSLDLFQETGSWEQL